MMRHFLGIFLAALLVAAPASAGLDDADIRLLEFSDLEGWAEDDHDAAMVVFIETCALLNDGQWRPVCNLAKSFTGPSRQFFELFFKPLLIEDGKDPLFTAYYEPELRGSRVPTSTYRYPVYRMPPEARGVSKWLTRAEIETSDVMSGRGLEIAWVADPVELQFLQIQGSGRIRFADGSYIRLGYGGSNGHIYRSLGAELVRRGIYSMHQVSAPVISAWVKRNPVDGQALLRTNPSYVFFRVVREVPAHRGPIGAMNRSITAHRSLAVDPKYTPLGAPVWLEKDGANPFRRLMIAQDTGSRIKGAQRADIFFGTGDEAGRLAGRVRDPGRMIVLLPIQRAYALVEE